MMNQTLAQYCTTDSALVKEQKKIEGQLKAFEEHLWESDSISQKDIASKKASSIVKAKAIKSPRRKAQAVSEVKVKKEKSSPASAPKASVRRQRR
jgi:hypothetical protein